MLTRLLFLFAIAAPFAISGCATPYQDDSPWHLLLGGYSDYRVDENTFVVSFRGGNNTSSATVGTYLLFRCAEVTSAAGFEYFQVVGQESDQRTGTVMLPGHSRTQGSVTGSVTGNTIQAFGTSQTTTIPSQMLTIRSDTATATIKGYKEKPSGMAAYRSAEVINYLGPTIKRN